MSNEKDNHLGIDAFTATVIERLAVESMELDPIDISPTVKMTKRHKDNVIEFHDLEKFQAVPRMVREKPSFTDSDSFIAYVKEFRDNASKIFFNDATKEFVAVLDYSAAASDEDVTSLSPRWGLHVATMKLSYSDEWDLWFARNGKRCPQIEFGRFLEENIADIASPDGATLLEMVMNFESHKTVAFREATRLKSGITQFSYVEEEKNGTVDVPDVIVIRVPIFLGMTPELVKLRFRYRIEEQKLGLSYEFIRVLQLVREAQARVVNLVSEGTGINVLLGKRH